MDPRGMVNERGLTAVAVRHLTADAFGELPFDALGPTKALLKRWFSPVPWSDTDDEALADAVGPGQGWWQHQLDEDLMLSFGWVDGRFKLEVTSAHEGELVSSEASAGTFDGPVTPEATPNPRTVMFRTGPIQDGPSRPFRPSERVDDPRVDRLFKRFGDITDVLVAADFVAISLRRPDRWESLLDPVLEAVTEEFAGEGGPGGEAGPSTSSDPELSRNLHREQREGRLERAWRELGSLRPDRQGDLERVLAAAYDEDAARRQVAANLLREADPGAAAGEWSRLVHDRSRQVRRATMDAMVDVGREELRPTLEHGLDDEDAWVRWKAIRGLADLGVGTSRKAVEALTDDPDFRVRREAMAALGT